MLAHALPTAAVNPIRAFGRFELRRLLGKSAGTMSWLAADPATGRELMLTMPRVQPADAAALEHWQRDARAAARLSHPHLAAVAEFGVQDHWPFVAVDRAHGVTLTEWIEAHPPRPLGEVVGWVCALLHGLAFAHEAGVPHLDLQLHHLLIDEHGTVRLMALGAAGDSARVERARASERANERTMAMDPGELRERRAAAARDLLACGLLLHRLLAGRPPLDEPDPALAMARLAPVGRELVQLAWGTPQPVPPALRAIANRWTAGHQRLRYQNARTPLAALVGWLEAHAQQGSGPLALLNDRLLSIGHLPALPGLARRVARVTQMETQRTDDIADQVLDDLALSFELLRTLNTAQVQGTQAPGNGPVLTLRRIISLIGVNGVRLAANTLRPWPGPLNATQATALQATLDRVRFAGRVARALRPPGYDAQVVTLIAMLQNLGRLMLRYHFADDAAQIDQLTLPGAAGRDAAPFAGLGEEAATFAVLGVDLDALGSVAARQWGLADEVMLMARRLHADAPLHKPQNDAEMLRATASAANDLVDAIPAGAAVAQTAPAAGSVERVVTRYAKALQITAREVHEALHAARTAS